MMFRKIAGAYILLAWYVGTGSRITGDTTVGMGKVGLLSTETDDIDPKRRFNLNRNGASSRSKRTADEEGQSEKGADKGSGQNGDEMQSPAQAKRSGRKDRKPPCTFTSLPSSDIACPDGHVCKALTCGTDVFSCRFAGPEKGEGVMFLHGFPFNGSFFVPLMNKLSSEGHRSVSCDLRGYSKGAGTDAPGEYHYGMLRNDVEHIAATVFPAVLSPDGTTFVEPGFHLVGHDHGAVLGEYEASRRSKTRILSFTSLSMPPIDVLATRLFGDGADAKQQASAQYFTAFVQKGAAKKEPTFGTLKNIFSWLTTPDDLQKRMNWYQGLFNDKLMSMPPMFTVDDLKDPELGLTPKGAQFSNFIRTTFGPDVPWDRKGYAKKTKVGKLPMPALYICGKKDFLILCDDRFAILTKTHCPDCKVQLHEDCGHNDILRCVGDVISTHIQSAKAK